MSEIGFYHPDRGYWQTISAPPQSIVDAYPDGTIMVPLRPSRHHVWDGAQWVYQAPPVPTPDPITADQVKTERDLRIEAIAAGYTRTERETWHVQAAEAKAYKADATSPTPMLTLLARARGIPVDQMADRVLGLSAAFAVATGSVMAAASALMAMDPIPLDYTDDSYWP